MVGICKNYNEPSGSIKIRKFLYWLNKYQEGPCATELLCLIQVLHTTSFQPFYDQVQNPLYIIFSDTLNMKFIFGKKCS
jgi:hypothetical protein